MNLLITGPFGSVGENTVTELIKMGIRPACFDLRDSPHYPLNRKIARRYAGDIDVIWGDLRDREAVRQAVAGRDVVIHLAAIIPPLADREPEMAQDVNVGGTRNVVEAILSSQKRPRLIYTSSVAVYGDVRDKKGHVIRVSDPLPAPVDEYSAHKIEAERIVREANITYAILRLSFVFCPERLKLDPLMFHVPLDTEMEPVHSSDAGLAVARAAFSKDIWGKTLNIAGGQRCRTNYREFLGSMLDIFGLGMLPDEAFSKDPFHMGFMDTQESQRQLSYQRKGLSDLFSEAERSKRLLGILARLTRPIGRRFLLSKSEFYKKNPNKA